MAHVNGAGLFGDEGRHLLVRVGLGRLFGVDALTVGISTRHDAMAGGQWPQK